MTKTFKNDKKMSWWDNFYIFKQRKLKKREWNDIEEREKKKKDLSL